MKKEGESCNKAYLGLGWRGGKLMWGLAMESGTGEADFREGKRKISPEWCNSSRVYCTLGMTEEGRSSLIGKKINETRQVFQQIKLGGRGAFSIGN